MNKDLTDIYELAEQNCGLQKGDIVKVTRRVESYDFGWVNTWADEMTSCVYKEGVVEEPSNNGRGVRVRFKDKERSYCFPFFVLEKVETPEEVDCAEPDTSLDDFAIGHTVVVRTYAAGVWFGVLSRKVKNEVILTDARRMWEWWCKESISLSGVVRYGINQEKSRIAPPIDAVWLEAIEIMPIHGAAMDSIRDAPIVQPS